MCNDRLLILFLFIFLWCGSSGQNCQLTVDGFVTDEATGRPLSAVNVIVQETGFGIFTEDDGAFTISNLCPGEYHITFSHIGCENLDIHLDVAADTVIDIKMPHTAISLKGVTIEGEANALSNQPSVAIKKKDIEDNTNESLSGLLKNVSGVHLIQNGSGITKPIVHGLSGNRLVILNNGIPQSGQQWGRDHAPEIDPLTANKITVLKGTNAIAYSGGNMGSLILVEPSKIAHEPHLHGSVSYAFETNGRGHIVNAQAQKHNHTLSWRAVTTFKKYGDRSAADYFLNNTGSNEINAALQLEKVWKESVFTDVFISTFNTTLGVLRGSHIGNLPDLEDALMRDVPLFTEEEFSYEIEAPRQKVSHHLAKINTKFYFQDDQSIQLTLAGQLNDRKEFDVRRSGRSDIPALSLKQYTVNADINYVNNLTAGGTLKAGFQNTFTDNTNDPETGILPLIPDYFTWKTGIFTTLTKTFNKINLNAGVRYDFETQDVVAISMSQPREILRFDNQFHNVNAAFGLKYDISEIQTLTINTGYAMRNPAINELYSNGLHQGVSGIEEGNAALETERGIKSTLEYKLVPSANVSISALGYYHRFDNYIFLDPQEELRLTIRGAFPVFVYNQTDAEIFGLDIASQFSAGRSFAGLIKYSFIRGNDIEANIPLVNIAPGNIYGSLTYRVDKMSLQSSKRFENIELSVNYKYVFEQKNLLPEQDFVLPPDAYGLLGLEASTNIGLPKNRLRVVLRASNVLNVSYRDYLNRQRYFADDAGRSVTASVQLKF